MSKFTEEKMSVAAARWWKAISKKIFPGSRFRAEMEDRYSEQRSFMEALAAREQLLEKTRTFAEASYELKQTANQAATAIAQKKAQRRERERHVFVGTTGESGYSKRSNPDEQAW